ncbi:Os05g0347101 [Oryza sativa Japonica Group]|uniref:Os05g0347101 protein n=1 Tax=Oryza sativa subsp. japonica TaxID=39947 RepID=A0A0P0WLB7_ORYSJ|nr:Os05g0347101 [Oryza sativa Japonica Group]
MPPLPPTPPPVDAVAGHTPPDPGGSGGLLRRRPTSDHRRHTSSHRRHHDRSAPPPPTASPPDPAGRHGSGRFPPPRVVPLYPSLARSRSPAAAVLAPRGFAGGRSGGGEAEEGGGVERAPAGASPPVSPKGRGDARVLKLWICNHLVTQ